ncbi:MAG TPA: hypothetical protein VGK20_03205 [Candidatus Binatia bacterium]|jgi:hypothetical protein
MLSNPAWPAGAAAAARLSILLIVLAPLSLLVVAILAAASPAAYADSTRTHCDVAFDVGPLGEHTSAGLLDFTVQYLRPKIFPLDPQGQVRCTGVAPGSAAAAANHFLGSQAGALTVAFASAAGAPPSSEVLRCDVYSAGASTPTADDFSQLVTVSARDAASVAIDPLPSVSIGTIRCGDAGTTTTTTTTVTTTTRAPSSTTTTTLEPRDCTVKFRVDSATSLARVRFSIDYSKAGGRLPQVPSASCASLLSSAGIGIESSEPRTMTVDLVSVTAFHGPADLVTCNFVPVSEVAGPSAFVVKALAANDASGAPAGLPTLSASGVDCVAPTTTTAPTTTSTLPSHCGDANNDGILEAGDALAALKESVGLASACTLARCDVDDSGTITAGDALKILKAAVGSPGVVLDCPVA